MHVVVVNIHFAPFTYGGATIVAEEVAKALVARHDVTVSAISTICREDLEPYAVMRTTSEGFDSYLINIPAKCSFENTYSNVALNAAITRLWGRLSPDVVHVHCVQRIGADVVRLAKEAGYKTVLSVHDYWWLCERQFMVRTDGAYCDQDAIDLSVCAHCVPNIRKTQKRQAHLFKAMAAADLITFPSQHARDLHVASGLRALADKMVIWHNGVRLPEAAFFVQQKARRDADKRVVFGFVGGPSQLKGWPLIRDAFAGLGRDDFRGLLVDGGDVASWWPSERRAELWQLKGDWSIVEKYSQDTMDGFYAQIDVLLFMSQWKETFGLTIREALSRGIRVIQTDSGGTTEHPALDADRLIPIGASAERLQQEITACLEADLSHPIAGIESYSDQADNLMAWLSEPERSEA
ncbi:glycosyltransferase [uncultured Celeribacter sp.]|uniref:glycosyltransferase n=1 Tax=uncultured Celeribacter sp. TaxID=1303376 RepID=UPI002AA75502|nr:glycosyltransferase [uncultured Celeribacter sp.]